MSVSVERAKKHVAEWKKRLAQFPLRASWPQHLFHTCQYEVAVEIIRNNGIICRADVPELICDVANQGALWNNPEAHRYVRLYFRPKNWFHLKTEGVKYIGDPGRVDPHMSIPITFAFDFVKVITLSEAGFVFGNFAKTGAQPKNSDQDLDKLKFDLIYHDSPLPAERVQEVNNWRMSEVVVSNRLGLEHVSCIICRTPHEERTLRFALAKKFQTLPIIVEQKGAVFMRRGIFLDEVYMREGKLCILFHAPVTSTKTEYKIKITCSDDQPQSREGIYQLAAGTRWSFPFISNAKAVWRVEIEDCVLFCGTAPSLVGVVPS